MQSAFSCCRIVLRAVCVPSLLLFGLLVHSPAPLWAAEPVDFNQDIRPILSNHCYSCHGPDANDRQAGLRLDTKEGLFSLTESEITPVVAGDPKASDLIARIESDDEFVVMPPPEHHKPLSAKQKSLLKRWITEGAPYAKHWSFVTPTRPVPPKVAATDRVKTPIDRFILKRLEREGLSLNEEADRRTLIRRVTLDLTGLPPTPEAVEAFVNDTSPNAYEKVVDRLLASERYGEHMTRYWLDLVRYADTHGLHLDNYREMWPYRDWVVDRFNENQPYNRFITEQLAGDLLENPTLEQQIASGFNRLHVTTSEGGSIYEEVYVRNVVERVEGFGTIFLGMTTGCAVCHDHKFDPISMREFYQLFAYFNSLDGRALDGNKKDHAPVVKVPTPESQRRLDEIQRRLAAVQKKFDNPSTDLDAAQLKWEALALTRGAETPVPTRWQVLTPEQVSAKHGAMLTTNDKQIVTVGGTNAPDEVYEWIGVVADSSRLRGLRLEVFPPEGSKKGAGRSPNTNAVLTELVVEIAPANDPEAWRKVKLVRGKADYSQSGGDFDVKFAIDSKFIPNQGWAIEGHGKPGQRTAWFESESPFGFDQGTRIRVRLHHESTWKQHAFTRFRVAVTADDPINHLPLAISTGPWSAIGPIPYYSEKRAFNRKFASEGGKFDPDSSFKYGDETFRWREEPEMHDSEVHVLPTAKDGSSLTVLRRTLEASDAGNIDLLLGTKDGYKLYVNDKLIRTFDRPRSLSRYSDLIAVPVQKGTNTITIKLVNLSGGPSRFAFAVRGEHVTLPEPVRNILVLAPDARSELQQNELRDYFRKVAGNHSALVALRSEMVKLIEEEKQVGNSLPTTLVWKETASPRDAFLLKRGQYDQKGDKVGRDVPSALPPMQPDWPQNRLGLARWLTSPEHPLTSRVAVNRFWQQIFGNGLVKTSEDFGAQGEPPSHPKLLDWLAVDFRESGWDVKGLMKQIVMSSAYRQTSRISDRALELDPENRLLSRGPRFRLDAETLRDQALFASGLLVLKQGGPSVKPPQPAGLWKAVGYSDSNTANFKADSGDKIYRRSVYTFWKRTAPAPTMSTFDAPSRESCTARRERTNTPLQALLLMNEQQYLQAARSFAQRVFEAGGTTEVERVDFAYRTLVARPPTVSERDVVLSLYRDALEEFKQNAEEARGLLMLKPDESVANQAELAAWTLIGNLLLNLDEVVSKN